MHFLDKTVARPYDKTVFRPSYDSHFTDIITTPMLNIDLDHIVTSENAAARIQEIFSEVQLTGKPYLVTVNGVPAVTINPATLPNTEEAPVAAAAVPTPEIMPEPVAPAAPSFDLPDITSLPPIVEAQPFASLDEQPAPLADLETELATPEGPAPITTDAPAMNIPTPPNPPARSAFNDLPDMPEDPSNSSPLA